MLFFEYLNSRAKIQNRLLGSVHFSILYRMRSLWSKSDKNCGTIYIFGDTYFSNGKTFFSFFFQNFDWPKLWWIPSWTSFYLRKKISARSVRGKPRSIPEGGGRQFALTISPITIEIVIKRAILGLQELRCSHMFCSKIVWRGSVVMSHCSFQWSAVEYFALFPRSSPFEKVCLHMNNSLNNNGSWQLRSKFIRSHY